MSLSTEPTRALEIFFCYARKDEELRDELEKNLRILQRQGQIITWHDRQIGAGKEWGHEIDTHLNAADIILLLVSPDFMDSDYCYGVEMKKALERHARGEARVIPVILRRVHWQDAPFSKLQVLPTDGLPVTRWADRDEAFWNVTDGILQAVKELTTNFEASSRTMKPRVVSLPKDASHTPVDKAKDRVVVVAAKNALPEYLKCSAYICQPNRPIQDCTRLAFYTNNKIDRRVPKILGQVQAISKDEIETRMDLSDVDRIRLRNLFKMLDSTRRDDWRQQLKIIFLSPSDSQETLILPHDIVNDLTSSTGRGVGVAFTQGQRYVSLSRLEMGPKRTSELV